MALAVFILLLISVVVGVVVCKYGLPGVGSGQTFPQGYQT